MVQSGSQLEAAGPPIGSNDLLIAAHACATGTTIVAANTDEFERIHSLTVETRRPGSPETIAIGRAACARALVQARCLKASVGENLKKFPD